MKYLVLLLVTFACLLSFDACRSKQTHEFGTDQLETMAFHIPTDRDTVIQTKNGALLDIPKGTLDAGDSKYADLEIKEAFTLEQIIMGGLTTTSNGIPLSSGGMIYVNSKEGQKVSIRKPIRVAIPANYLQKGMELYKCETTKEAKINWKDPVALPENPQMKIYEEGNMLFQQHCANCHKLGKEFTGPDLAHYLKIFGPLRQEGFAGYSIHRSYVRRPSSAITEYISDGIIKDTISYQATFSPATSGELFICNLIRDYGSMGPAYRLSGDEFDRIYSYIQQESDRLALPMPFIDTLKKSTDSCVLYREQIARLQQEKEKATQEKQQLIEKNGSLVIKNPDTTWLRETFPLPPDFDQRVSPQNYDAVYYQFTIDSFGWFNIDMLAKGVDGVKDSELFVRIRGQYQERIKVYLIIPSVKVYGEGGPAEKDPALFAFFYKNGKLPLPQGVQAFILAITDSEGSPVYGITAFRTDVQQEIPVTLHAASKEEFRQAVSEFEAGRLHIKVNDAKNADNIRKKDTLLRSIEEQKKAADVLRPKYCDCNCGGGAADSTYSFHK